MAITVDHGLNPDSQAWGLLCRKEALGVGADWIECHWRGPRPATGLPAAARRARHALIAEAARSAGARVVLFAQTADDIAEADWMRERGATLGQVREWSPSPAWPEGRGLMLLRPMLGEGREPLRDWLRARGRDWIEDPGNADSRFARTRARTVLVRKGERQNASDTRDPHSWGLAHRSGLSAPSPLPLGDGFEVARSISTGDLAAVLLCASGTDTPPRRDRLEAIVARLTAGEDFTATLAGARVEAGGEGVRIGREPGEFKRRPPDDVVLVPGVGSVWDGRYEVTASEPGWTVTAALGRLNRLAKADRSVVDTVPGWARGALPVLIRDAGDAPVLAWRKATVRNLAPRRLRLAHWGRSGETTQECELSDTMHGETPPPDLF